MKKYINLSDRTERLLDNLKCRTEADTVDEVIRKAVMIYNLVGTAIEQGHKIVIGNEAINLMEFHPVVIDDPGKAKSADPAEGKPPTMEEAGFQRVK